MVLTGTKVPLPDERIAHRVFEAHAARHPDRPALTCGDERLTYGELDARANQVAHYLASVGVARGSIVGVCIDRSSALMATILGVLKLGAAYVPLDPSYPHDRLRLMTSQLPQMSLVAAATRTLELVDGAHETVLAMDDPALGLDGFPTTSPKARIDNDRSEERR